MALEGIEGALCEPFDRDRWRAALAPLLADPDPRVDGRARAELFSSDRMAARVVAAWRELVRGARALTSGGRGAAYTRWLREARASRVLMPT